MPKLWRFSCCISLTPVQSMAKHNSFVSTVASRHLIIIRMGDVDIQLPRECIDILRSRPFAFSARRCNKFAVGRVILAGDSAHVFPPCKYQPEVCFPQGSDELQLVARGFPLDSDSSGLAWCLGIAIREKSKNYEQLISGWFEERKQQLRFTRQDDWKWQATHARQYMEVFGHEVCFTTHPTHSILEPEAGEGATK